MKRSQVFILFAVFTILAAAAFLKARHPVVSYSPDIYSKVPVLMDRDNASRLRIGRERESVDLIRKDGAWTVASLWNYPADSGKVDALLAALQNLEGEMRSGAAELLEDYGIADGQGVPIKIFEGEKETALVLGTRRPDETSAFVRMAGSPVVYLTERNLFSLAGIRGEGETLRTDIAFWPALELIPDPEVLKDVLEIRTFREGSKGLEPAAALSKKEEGWTFAGGQLPFSVDEEKVSYFLEALRQGRAVRAAGPGKDYGFGRKGWRIALTLPEGRALNAFVAADEEGRLYFQTDRSPQVYEISVYTAKSLQVGNAYFIKDNPLETSSGVQGIVLKQDGSEMFLASGEQGSRAFTQAAAALEGLEEKLTLSEKIKPEAWPSDVPYRIEVRLEGGDTRVLEFLENSEEEGGYPLRILGDERIFVLSEEKFPPLFAPLNGGQAPEESTGDGQTAKQ